MRIDPLRIYVAWFMFIISAISYYASVSYATYTHVLLAELFTNVACATPWGNTGGPKKVNSHL
jgi:hypothetical protein